MRRTLDHPEARDRFSPIASPAGSLRCRNCNATKGHDLFVLCLPRAFGPGTARDREAPGGRRAARHHCSGPVADGARRASTVSGRRLSVALRLLHAGAAALRARGVQPHRSRASRPPSSTAARCPRGGRDHADRRAFAGAAPDAGELRRRAQDRPLQEQATDRRARRVTPTATGCAGARAKAAVTARAASPLHRLHHCGAAASKVDSGERDRRGSSARGGSHTTQAIRRAAGARTLQDPSSRRPSPPTTSCGARRTGFGTLCQMAIPRRS